MAAGGQATIAMAPDGRVWTWGVHLGVKSRTNVWGKMIQSINDFGGKLGINRGFIPPPTLPLNLHPRLIWQASTNALPQR